MEMFLFRITIAGSLLRIKLVAVKVDLKGHIKVLHYSLHYRLEGKMFAMYYKDVMIVKTY